MRHHFCPTTREVSRYVVKLQISHKNIFDEHEIAFHFDMMDCLCSYSKVHHENVGLVVARCDTPAVLLEQGMILRA